jgi:hypothetical protein
MITAGLTPFAVTRTPVGGVALSGAGTPTFLQWTAPNDGQMHYASVSADENVTSALTGGGATVTYTADGTPSTATILPAGAGVGGARGSFQLPIDPGSTVSMQQQAIVSAGAAVVNAVIVGI